MTRSLLVLGGTVFLGFHVAQEALGRGMDVTVFTRGRSGPPPSGCQHVLGDRDGDLDGLRGRTFDAVVDTSGRSADAVRRSAALLAGAVQQYVFVSTVSVYADPTPGGDESDALLTAAAMEDEAQAYGSAKAACESAVAAVVGPDRTTIVRPGLVVGPRDPTGRFSWWVLRPQRPGTMLAPGDPARPVQIIDVRDLARFLVDVALAPMAGTFDAVGPAESFTMGGLVESCRRAAGGVAQPIWVEDHHLLAHGARPWTELPLWLPRTENAVLERSGGRAHDAGLEHRPVADTVTDTAAWLSRAEAPMIPGGVGIAFAKERDLIEGWESSIRG